MCILQQNIESVIVLFLFFCFFGGGFKEKGNKLSGHEVEKLEYK